MKKFNVVAASAVALSAALASGSALAHGTLAVTTATYNAASVTANAGTITVPWSGVAGAVYTVSTTGNAVATSLEVNSRFTVTLPTGFSFASTPAIAVAAPSAAVFANGGIGSQTATFTIAGAPVPLGGTLTLLQASVQGATALETPGAKLSITVQSTNNAEINNNDPQPVSATNGTPAFASDSGVTASFINGGGNSIDLTPAEPRHVVQRQLRCWRYVDGRYRYALPHPVGLARGGWVDRVDQHHGHGDRHDLGLLQRYRERRCRRRRHGGFGWYRDGEHDHHPGGAGCRRQRHRDRCQRHHVDAAERVA
ncbi:MAG: hypothetical protein WDN69_35980 [Aliidongia sp.]